MGGGLPFVRGRGTGAEVPVSAVGAAKAEGPGKDGHRSELQRRPYAGPSACALLRALRALRNPALSRPFRLSRSKPLQSHLRPRPPASHPLRIGGGRWDFGVGERKNPRRTRCMSGGAPGGLGIFGKYEKYRKISGVGRSRRWGRVCGGSVCPGGIGGRGGLGD